MSAHFPDLLKQATNASLATTTADCTPANRAIIIASDETGGCKDLPTIMLPPIYDPRMSPMGPPKLRKVITLLDTNLRSLVVPLPDQN